MKRDREFVVNSPNNSNQPQNNTQKPSGRCPREFFSTIPHPLPVNMGMQFYHSVVSPHGFLRDGSLPFPPISGNMCGSIQCQPSIMGERMKTARIQHRMNQVKNNGSINRWEDGESNYNAAAKEAPKCIQNSIQNESDEQSAASIRRNTDIKRIWPVMGFGKLDIREKSDHYQIYLDIPGIPKESVDVLLKSNSIVVECTRIPVASTANLFSYTERPVGILVRNIRLPLKANSDDISCKCQDGVLSINIGKLKEDEDNIKKICVI